MNAPEIYHLAVTVFSDIGDNDPDDKQVLHQALQHLKNRRLLALEKQHVIPKQSINVKVPDYKKEDEAPKQQ